MKCDKCNNDIYGIVHWLGRERGARMERLCSECWPKEIEGLDNEEISHSHEVIGEQNPWMPH